MKNKVIALESSKINPNLGVSISDKVSLAEDIRRAEYREIGSDKEVLDSTAVVLFCSGKGTRLITGQFTKPTMELPIPSRRTPLELLLKSISKDIGQIIISVLPEDKYTKQYLKNNEYFNIDPRKITFVIQPMVDVSDYSTVYPGGTGYIFTEVMQDKNVLDEKIRNIMFIDGEKMGVDANMFYEYLGFHVEGNKDLTVATYSLKEDSGKKFAHIDILRDKAYSGKNTPEKLRIMDNNNFHHLGGGVYLVNKDLQFSELQEEVEIKKGITFREKPIIALVNAVSEKNPNQKIAYFQRERGALGVGIKDRKSILKNLITFTESKKHLFQKNGWNIGMGNDPIIELMGMSEDSILSPNSTIMNNSSFFLYGSVSFGENNIFSGEGVFCNPGNNKIIQLGTNNNFNDSFFSGEAVLGDRNVFKSSMILSVGIEGLKKMLSDNYLVVKKLWRVSRIVNKLKEFLYKDHLFDNYLIPYLQNNSVIIGSDSTIENSLIIGECIIGNNVTIKDSVLYNAIIEDDVVIRKATLEDAKVKSGSFINTSYLKGQVGKNGFIQDSSIENYILQDDVTIKDNSKLINSEGISSFEVIMPQGSEIRFCVLNNVRIYPANPGREKAVLLEGRNFSNVRLLGGASLSELNSLSSGNINNLSVQHRKLLYFFHKLNPEFRNSFSVDVLSLISAEDLERALIKQIIGKELTLEDIDNPEQHPGFFTLREMEKEYDKTFDGIKKYIDYIIHKLKDKKAKKEFSEYMDAFMNISLFIEYIGMRLIDVMSVQEIKGIIYKMFRMYAPNVVKEERQSLEKIDSVVGKAIETSFYDNNLSITDRICLAIGANWLDFTNDNISFFISHLDYRDASFFEDLIIYGSLKENMIVFLPGFDKVAPYLSKELRGDNFYYTVEADKDFFNVISSLHLSQPESELWKTFSLFTQNKVANIKKILGSAVDDLAEKINKSNRILYFLDNLVEMRFDFELIRAIIGERKDSDQGLSVKIIARSREVENDVDTKYLEESLSELIKYAPDNVSVSAMGSHNSALLGHDIRFFDVSLMQQLKGSLIIAKGLGNMLTMQNFPYPIYFLLTLKGFMGQKIAEVLEMDSNYVLYKKDQDSSFRDKYREHIAI